MTSQYRGYLDGLYSSSPALSGMSYEAQLQAINGGLFAWSDFWLGPFEALGYETKLHIYNCVPIQQTWAKENGFAVNLNLAEIAARQIDFFRPDILWFDDCGAPVDEILCGIKQRPRLVVGWSGSAIPQIRNRYSLDLVLSCAPEAVETLKQRGMDAAHLNHAFQPSIVEVVGPVSKIRDLAFMGQIIHREAFHIERERMLEDLVRSGVELELFTPQIESDKNHRIPNIARAKSWAKNLLRGPTRGLSSRLREVARPPVYGKDMYREVARSRLVLNIHADSSPRYVSNARLFEITGMGSCMICDWRANISQLFDPGTEIVSYRNANECRDAITQLINYPEQAVAVAARGQKRCHKDHNFSVRAVQWHEIIQARLR